MRKLQTFVYLALLFSVLPAFAQGNVNVTGKVVEQDSQLPLEFATVTLLNPSDNSVVNGGMTDAQGQFKISVAPGSYIVKYEFISFKTVQVNKQINGDTTLETVTLAPDATVLKEVQIEGQASTVDIQLDKRVYTVGNDMMVKGGTVSDVLDNVPSISVDAEGNVALRGNQSVTILIDGRPSNLAGSNIADVLRLLPADSVEKVEVITNPSARYDAEGGGGIINIILKKGKADGFNGSVTATTGYPDNHGIMANLNFRSRYINVFSNLAYNYRNSPGISNTNSEYLNEDGSTSSFVNENSDRDRLRRGVNGNVGFDLFLDETLTWTNSIGIRETNGKNPTKTYYDYFNADGSYNYSRFRLNFEEEEDSNVNYSSYILKKFNEDGHELKVDFAISKSLDDEDAAISDESTSPAVGNLYQRTYNYEQQDRMVIQADYVLPFNEDSRFEAGYRGSFTTQDTDFEAQDFEGTMWQTNFNYTYHLVYKEKVNAFYAQYGSKYGNFSYMAGLRWEDSNIDVNLLNDNDYNNKRYNNFFPSAFLNYEFSEKSNVTISYSRRINRPRDRFLNPFGGLQSNINIFRGNPDLDPAMTNAFDLGYMYQWSKLTLSTSAYMNITDNTFQFVRTRQGETADGTPITVTSPVNLAQEYRFGAEFNINYNPFKWWRINSNFNFFRNETNGDYTFNYNDPETGEPLSDYQNFDNVAYSWFTRVNSKISLPWKIDWQLNADYRGAETNAQGKRRGVASMNTALSKDILKDKATIALNVQDVFNSRKWKNEIYIPGELRAYSEMQWRQRQVTLSFTYRFNMNKADRQKEQREGQPDGGGEDYIGG